MANSALAKVERLLVCVGPSPSSAEVIKAAKSLAAGLKAEWFAVYVEDPKMLRLREAARNRAVYNLRLAEQLGAETLTLRGRSIAEELAICAINWKPTRLGRHI
jgi:two-component system sensor histidine kinase KdpD